MTELADYVDVPIMWSVQRGFLWARVWTVFADIDVILRST